METILNIFLFSLCLNAAAFIIAYGLDVEFLKANIIDPETFVIPGVQAAVDSATAATDPFTQAQLVFGNFIAGLSIFTSIITGDYLSRMISLFGAGIGSTGQLDLLVLPIRMITTFLTAIGIMYMLTGRGSKSEI